MEKPEAAPPPDVSPPEVRSARLAWLASVLRDPEGEVGAREAPQDAELDALERERASLPRDRLVAAYRRVFGHTPGGPCPLYELSWLKAGDFAAEQELADIGGFYRAFGVCLATSARERVDHVSIELEFLAYLAHLEAEADGEGREELADVAREAQRSFLRDHLGRWAPIFFERMEASSAEAFLEQAARFARRELDRLFGELDVHPAVHKGEPAEASAPPPEREAPQEGTRP
jgi:TorA maturation chaperone TorD